MKTTKRIMSLFLSLIMMLSITAGIDYSAYAYNYDGNKAIEYAKAHWNDGVGQCAEFVSNCLVAGGFPTKLSSVAGLSGFAGQITKYGTKVKSSTTGTVVPVKLSSFNGTLKKGDPICILYSTASGSGNGHVVIYSGETTSNGIVKIYAHNRAKNNEPLYAGYKGSPAIEIFAVNLSGSGGGTVAPQPAASTLTLSTSNVNLNIDSSSTATVSMTAGGTLPSKIATTYKTSNGNVQCSWNKWSGNTCSLNITAKNVGTSKITVNLINNSTNAVLDTKTINVNVKSNKYTVKFNANGGYGAPSNMTVSSRDVATIPDTKPYTNISNNVTFDANGGTLTNGSKTEYKKVFKYWYDNDGNQYYAGSTYVFKKNTTLYAKYAYETLDAKTPTKSNCYFDGWYDSKETDSFGVPTGKKYTNRNSYITSDITLYAMWTQNSTFKFGDPNKDGKVSNSDVVWLNYYINGNIKNFTSSQLFASDVNVDGKITKEDVNLLENVVVGKINYGNLPIFSKSVSVDIKSISKTNYEYGEEFDYDGIVLQSNYSNSNVHHEIKDDYIVTGYDPYKIGKQTITIKFYQYSTTATVTVKAPNYEVKLNTVSGIADKTSVDVTLGTPMTSLPVPEKEGYTFVGWFDAEEGGNQITSSTVFNSLSSNEIYAHWEKNKYSVTFNSNGGNNSPQNLSNVLYDTSITIESTIPQKSGLVFKGWSLINEDTGEYLYPGQTLNIEKDTTLYAIYGEQSVISQSSYVEGYVANSNMPATFKFVAPKTEYYHFDIFGQENLSATIKYGNVALSTTNNTNYENGFAFDVKLFENQEYILTISSNENDEYFLAYVESLDNIEHSHDYVETERVEATTSSEGYIKYTCSICGDTKVTTIPKLQPAPTQPSTPATQPTQAPTQQPAPAPTQAPTKAPINAPASVAPAPAEPTTVANTAAPTTATQVEQTTTKAVAKPKAAKFKKVKGSKKAIALTWAKVKGVKGYQIQVATDKKFKKNKKTVTIKKQKTTKTTVKKLKAKKKYFVRIRTYKTVNGKKVYSSWSKAKTVKTK